MGAYVATSRCQPCERTLTHEKSSHQTFRYRFVRRQRKSRRGRRAEIVLRRILRCGPSHQIGRHRHQRLVRCPIIAYPNIVLGVERQINSLAARANQNACPLTFGSTEGEHPHRTSVSRVKSCWHSFQRSGADEEAALPAHGHRGARQSKTGLGGGRGHIPWCRRKCPSAHLSATPAQIPEV